MLIEMTSLRSKQDADVRFAVITKDDTRFHAFLVSSKTAPVARILTVSRQIFIVSSDLRFIFESEVDLIGGLKHVSCRIGRVIPSALPSDDDKPQSSSALMHMGGNHVTLSSCCCAI